MPNFSDAIRNDDIQLVRRMLEADPGLRARLHEPLEDAAFGQLPLNEAVNRKNLAMVDVLMEYGADINEGSHWWAGSFPPIELADKALIPDLEKRGAVVYAHIAARLGDVARLTDLLDEDPLRVHSRSGDGKTPLHYASSVFVAKLLLDRGADVNALDVDHESTPAQYLVSEHPDVARYLLTRGSKTDILLASALGAEELVRRILDRDPEAIRTRVNSTWFPMSDSRAGGSIYIWTLGGDKTAYVVAREKGQEKVAELLASYMTPAQLWDPLESTCRHASLSIL